RHDRIVVGPTCVGAAACSKSPLSAQGMAVDKLNDGDGREGIHSAARKDGVQRAHFRPANEPSRRLSRLALATTGSSAIRSAFARKISDGRHPYSNA
ncbi:hypothetical protein, partial [Ensifer adhaerens]|uniref:hypothetical protein n=1 Tax=Ensifer adhaerens TaxID=106592 RepID=UPI001AED7708